MKSMNGKVSLAKIDNVLAIMRIQVNETIFLISHEIQGMFGTTADNAARLLEGQHGFEAIQVSGFVE